MTFPLQQVAGAMGAAGDPADVPVAGWSVDSRSLAPGDLYFALRGPNHDGHDYAARALEAGAVAAVVDHATGAPRELRVPDTLRALQDLGRWARRQWGGSVVGVTGSAGKTTTKDAIAHLLSVEIATGRTVGNFNNHVGVPLSILRLPDDCRVAVLEMGMNHAGEIRELAAIALPEIGVVTNVGYAHVEFFDSIEGVAAAKRELIEALPARWGGGAERRRSAGEPLRRAASRPQRYFRVRRNRHRARGKRGIPAGRGQLPRPRRGLRDRPYGAARDIEPAGGDRRGARIRDCAGTPARARFAASRPARCAANAWSTAAWWCGTTATIPIRKRPSR